MGVLWGAMIRANTLQITPEILNLIAELDEFKGLTDREVERLLSNLEIKSFATRDE